MAKGMKSLQLSLAELIPKLGKPEYSVSKAAYTKARRKLKHTAFIELNQRAVIQTVYEDANYKTAFGFRLLAIDGSKVQLPTNPETKKEFGSFDAYIWSFVDGKPIANAWETHKGVPATTPISDAMSKDLKKRGFNFVGSTICYAFMQATGMVNDHLTSCFRYNEV